MHTPSIIGSVLLSLLLLASVAYADATLTWRDNSNNEDGFKVFRAENPRADDSAFVEIATVHPNITKYTDTPPNDGEYGYVVRAFNAIGVSRPTNCATTLNQPCTSGVPAAPTSLVVEIIVKVSVSTGG